MCQDDNYHHGVHIKRWTEWVDNEWTTSRDGLDEWTTSRDGLNERTTSDNLKRWIDLMENIKSWTGRVDIKRWTGKANMKARETKLAVCSMLVWWMWLSHLLSGDVFNWPGIPVWPSLKWVNLKPENFLGNKGYQSDISYTTHFGVDWSNNMTLALSDVIVWKKVPTFTVKTHDKRY